MISSRHWRCSATPPVAKPVLPADGAKKVSPLIGKVVLVLSEPMAEPPAGTFTLAVAEGREWVNTPLKAAAEYNPEKREWRWTLQSKLFPASRRVRVQIVPKAGKDLAGNPLAPKPIVWSFTTGANPLAKPAPEGLGGCPVGSPEGDGGSSPAEPCP